MPDGTVLYITRFVPAYRIPVLQRLNARLDGQLVVCAGDPPEASSLGTLARALPPDLRHVPLHNTWVGGERLHVQPFGRAFRAVPHPSAVLAEESPRSLLLPLLLSAARRRGAGTVLWGHFSSNDRPPGARHPFDRYRRWLARQADACACYTDGVARQLRPYVPAERLFVARNTLDIEALLQQHDALAAEGRAAVRTRLGLPPHAPVLVFLGRLIPEKGTGLLLDVLARVRRLHPETHLLVIGDGPERAALEAGAGADPAVRFLGTISDPAASSPFLFAADLLLMPGYLGLSVNHAFALGLPVVSRAAPAGARFHSPEVEYLQPRENGLLAERGDAEGLAEAVAYVLHHRDRLSANARAFAREHLTLDVMVDGLVEALRYAARS